MKKFLIRLAIFAVIVVVVGFGGVLIYAKSAASSLTLSPLTPAGSSVILASDGKTPLGHIASAQAGKQLDDVPSLIKQAHMAAEDRSFYIHGAISLPGLGGAMLKDAIGMSFDAGGSTITQQVAKKYVGTEKTLPRKIDELKYAYKLEDTYSKDQILVMYVNNNYYGRGAYGVEDGAQTWFGVSATTLNDVSNPLEVARAAFLAALIQQPGNFEKYQGQPSNLVKAKALRSRVQYVLDGLRSVAGLSQPQMVPQKVVDQAKGLIANGLSALQLTNTVKPSGQVTDGDPYLVGYIRDWMTAWQTVVAKSEDDTLTDAAAAQAGQTAAKTMLARGGLTIQTSIDARLQPLLVNAHQAELSGGAPSAAIVLNSRDGGVLAMSGGRDYSVDANNYAVNAMRPPGSTMKSFVLADAVSHGISANSVFAAPQQITLPGEGPPIHNLESVPGCQMTLADALAQSNNVVYSEAISGQMTSCNDTAHTTPISGYPVTSDDVAALLHKAGADASLVPGRDSPVTIGSGARLAIGGTILLSPLKLAVMYATLANGGTYHTPYLVSQITTSAGQTAFQHQDQSVQVLDAQTANIVNHAMQGVFTHGTAAGDQVNGVKLEGKTGTTDETQGDAWIAASNPENPSNPDALAMTLVGYAGKNPHLFGADVGKVAQDFFSHAMAGAPAVDLPQVDMNAGKLVGLNVPAPAPAPPPATTAVTTPPPPLVTTHERTTTPAAPTTSKPVPTTTRSVPTTEQTGGPATGVAPPSGNPPPPGQGQGQQ